jgi:hypothetical protein
MAWFELETDRARRLGEAHLVMSKSASVPDDGPSLASVVGWGPRRPWEEDQASSVKSGLLKLKAAVVNKNSTTQLAAFWRGIHAKTHEETWQNPKFMLCR